MTAKPPTSAELAELAELGTVLEFVVELGGGKRRVWRWTRGAPRLVAPDTRTILIVAGARRLGAAPMAERPAQIRETWTGKAAQRAYRLSLPDVGGRWRKIGRAVRLDYRSNKWTGGRSTVDYTHDHGPGVQVWARGDIDAGAGFLCARGGRLRITARGIVG